MDDKPRNMQVMSREEHKRKTMPQVSEWYRRGVTLENAINELFTLSKQVVEAGIEHSGYSLLEVHTQLAILVERYRERQHQMMHAMAERNRARDIAREMAETLADASFALLTVSEQTLPESVRARVAEARHKIKVVMDKYNEKEG